MAAAGDEVLLRVEDSVATLTLNRPDRLNAWTHELGDTLAARIEQAAADPTARAIVITGAGRGFCAGGDVALLRELEAGEAAFRLPPVPLSRLRDIPKPVIAAVNGPCAGIGLTLALHCDLRFAAADARLTTAFARLGLAAEQGMSHLLPRLVGPSRALDLMLSARVVEGVEAERIGLVDRVFARDELLAGAVAYARELAERSSPAAMAVIKWQSYRHPELSLAEATAESDELARRGLAGRDFRLAVASAGNGAPPAFPPIGADSLGDGLPLGLL